ncbi:MAG TPA: acetate--CoA ligase family protein [Syntrophales bacterium]|nr:acetate--CoA ligase family protein [Syntrophales bacterium]HPI56715.1 acetate--CoA ligase family protein [Syntrophales bacterium]HPN24860.1 acetate--CoA ligase family protein [Syntrophales bacterium]HQM30295.1 acetate--CoA ligase family protein [Syntrophales bacterium]
MSLVSQLDAIFKPKSVALIGASNTPGKLGYDVLYNLINAGLEGPIYPINPKADEILGLKVYKDIGSTPTPADLAVFLIPSRMVAGAIEECGKAGVKAAVVVTGGFAEAGEEGEKLQAELAAKALQYGVRVIGPNCQGVNSPYSNLCASWPLITTRGKIAFISQSGTVGAALIDWASVEHLGFSAFVSLGNRADVDESDCIRYFNEDPNTGVISLYVEGVKRPYLFMESLAKATKPVVILKAGRTARGKVAAESHTKSLAGSDAIYNAIFRKYRIYRADNLEELYDFSKALAYMEKPKGRRLLHISSSGGAAILAIDEAEKYGLESPAPSAVLKEKLRAFLPPHCGVSNPIDLTGDAITDPTLYSRSIEAAKSDYDTAVVIFGDPIHGASDIVTGKGEVVVFCGGADVEREEAALMHKKGIPVFSTPERGVRALAQFFAFDEVKTKKAEAGHAVVTDLMAAPEAVKLLKQYRIPAVDARFAATPKEAATLAKKFGKPVALKIASPDIAHKTDVGGVRLNVEKKDVEKIFRAMMKTVKAKVRKAKLEGVTVSPMAKPGGVEVIIGVITDPQYGPAMMFGLGGIFTEIYKDVRFCLLPAKEKDCMEMIRGITGYPVLAGARGQKPKDLKALVGVMKALSKLVTDHPEIDQIDLNPVLVYEKGVTVVDYRILTVAGGGNPC